MTGKEIDGNPCYSRIMVACSVNSPEYTGLHCREEFNAAAGHVRDLILSSIDLFRAGRNGPALFMAITSIEEFAKIKVGHSRSWGGGTAQVKRSKDPLFRHDDKHKIAFDPVLLIGRRLERSMGAARVVELFKGYSDGSFSELREEALYFSRCSDKLHIPSLAISRALVAEHIMVAIEMFDDFFDFMTQAVSEMCEEMNGLYPEIEAAYRESSAYPTRPTP